MSDARFQRRYGAKSEAFKQGYKGWATHRPLPNPYPIGSQEWADYNDGQWWAAYDYDEDKER